MKYNKKTNELNITDDYEVFQDKKLLDNLRKKIKEFSLKDKIIYIK